jgi:hypothetical protein
MTAKPETDGAGVTVRHRPFGVVLISPQHRRSVY